MKISLLAGPTEFNSARMKCIYQKQPHQNRIVFVFVFFLEPINFYHASIQLIEYPTAWTTGRRVQISWNPDELADRPITVQIINLGTIQVHSVITVVSEQENVGKAEFDLPELNNTR